MRHGWKIRIDERMYFENKKQERQERIEIMNMLRKKVELEMMAHLNDMKENHEIN